MSDYCIVFFNCTEEKFMFSVDLWKALISQCDWMAEDVTLTCLLCSYNILLRCCHFEEKLSTHFLFQCIVWWLPQGFQVYVFDFRIAECHYLQFWYLYFNKEYDYNLYIYIYIVRVKTLIWCIEKGVQFLKLFDGFSFISPIRFLRSQREHIWDWNLTERNEIPSI